MSAVIIPWPRRFSRHYFGGCPVCGETDGYRNFGEVHWFFCNTHCKRWSPGSDIFSNWQMEGEADWQETQRLIGSYENCFPMPPAPTIRHGAA